MPPLTKTNKASISQTSSSRPKALLAKDFKKSLPAESSFMKTDVFTSTNRADQSLVDQSQKLKTLSKQLAKADNRGPVKKALNWYVEKVDVPGPYGSPHFKDWPARKNAGNVSKWNDQVNYVNKNGTTGEKIIQRGALVTGVAAAAGAVVVGVAEAACLGNQSVCVHGALVPGAEPTLSVGGRPFFRVNVTGDWWRPVARQRFQANPSQANRLNLRPHYHRRPPTRPAGSGEGFGQHRPWQGGF